MGKDNDRYALSLNEDGEGVDMAKLLELLQKLFQTNMNMRAAQKDRVDYLRECNSKLTRKCCLFARRLRGEEKLRALHAREGAKARAEVRRLRRLLYRAGREFGAPWLEEFNQEEINEFAYPKPVLETPPAHCLDGPG